MREGVGGVDQLWHMELDGSGAAALTAADANRSKPSTAVGQTRVVFESNLSGNSDVYIANVDGTNTQNLTLNTAEDFEPVMSADGSTVAFLSNRDGSIGLYVMDSTGSNLRMVSNLAGIEGQGLALNADGSQVVFGAAPSGVPQVYIAGTNGSGTVNLSNDLNFFDNCPVFSPDGTKLAFVRDDDLWTMNVDGSGKTFLFSLGDLIAYPSYTADGSRIVFMGLLNFGWEIYSISSSGAGLANLTNTPVDEFKVSGYIGP